MSHRAGTVGKAAGDEGGPGIGGPFSLSIFPWVSGLHWLERALDRESGPVCLHYIT